MPEMTVRVRWPDNTTQDCYSPSLVMHDFLAAGTTYTVGEFVDRSHAALLQASERVRLKFGFACTSAQATRDQISEIAERFQPHDQVEVLAMDPPLPTEDLT